MYLVGSSTDRAGNVTNAGNVEAESYTDQDNANLFVRFCSQQLSLHTD